MTQLLTYIFLKIKHKFTKETRHLYFILFSITFQPFPYASKKPHDFGTSYLSPCLGDSGSGHWIIVNDDQTEAWKGVKMKQMALVAVYTTGLTGGYKLNGNHEAFLTHIPFRRRQIPCTYEDPG